MGDPVWYAKWRRLEGQEVVFLEWRIHHEVVRDYHFSGGLADHDCALKYEKCSIFFSFAWIELPNMYLYYFFTLRSLTALVGWKALI